MVILDFPKKKKEKMVLQSAGLRYATKTVPTVSIILVYSTIALQWRLHWVPPTRNFGRALTKTRLNHRKFSDSIVYSFCSLLPHTILTGSCRFIVRDNLDWRGGGQCGPNGTRSTSGHTGKDDINVCASCTRKNAARGNLTTFVTTPKQRCKDDIF